jgi:hypothetical protein
MNSRFTPRYFNPLLVWTNVALKTHEMLLSSGSVIQMRTERMALAGLVPSAADVAEFELMGHEKLAAASQSTAAIASQLQLSSQAMLQRTIRHWFGSASAFLGLVTSVTPAQAAANSHEWLQANARAAATATQLSTVGARVVQRGLKPIHAKATANARRLAAYES